ncbi:CsbD-like protein [Kitasatospora sp. SolWspMP-SS2h]|uniref:CsbD family protein n=1 Tax=Kitasatospora sp. SolWspMP-SS2h TaxID=1305729 RepID=UPI000DB932CC|nr:CsbD family protein [Kitasatospora sp. SolWspMP-SS2h]RAJ44735.1 CsbD-like protein [Kitasatospora sp. SolWspMP-SS2h]
MSTSSKLKGKVKETVGRAVGNKRLEAEGRTEQTKASLKQAGRNIMDVLKR